MQPIKASSKRTARSSCRRTFVGHAPLRRQWRSARQTHSQQGVSIHGGGRLSAAAPRPGLRVATAAAKAIQTDQRRFVTKFAFEEHATLTVLSKSIVWSGKCMAVADLLDRPPSVCCRARRCRQRADRDTRRPHARQVRVEVRPRVQDDAGPLAGVGWACRQRC